MTGGMGKNIEIYPMDHSPDSVGDDNENTTVVADDWEDLRLSRSWANSGLPGLLFAIGGLFGW